MHPSASVPPPGSAASCSPMRRIPVLCTVLCLSLADRIAGWTGIPTAEWRSLGLERAGGHPDRAHVAGRLVILAQALVVADFAFGQFFCWWQLRRHRSESAPVSRAADVAV